jgi:lipoprotein-anchoring transpeptidase ErfK/SrfK
MTAKRSCLSAATLCLVLAACTPTDPTAGYLAGVRPNGTRVQQGQALPDDISYWDDTGIAGPPVIKINRHLQKASFFKGGHLVGVSRISTGKEGHNTPPGTYKVIQKEKDHKSSIYGVFKDQATGQTIDDDVDIRTDKVPPGCVFVPAPMPNFLRFNGGIGMHTGYIPGFAASHGCVRMPNHMAEKFFANSKVGTPVIVE